MAIRLVKAGSPILYHATTTRAAASILTRDRFELKPSEGTSVEEELSGSSYYLSCSRNPRNQYVENKASSWMVILVLDGVALNTRYRIKPVDYWSGILSGSNDEMEDRVFSRSPFIAPATKYIKEVHSVMNDNDRQREALFQIKKAGLLHKIPTYFYDNTDSLRRLDKRAAKPLEVNFNFYKPDLMSPSYRAARIRDNYLYRWIVLYYTPIVGDPNDPDRIWNIVKKMPHSGKRAYESVRYPDAVNGFNADLHNAKSTEYESDSKEREALDTLVGIMRKNRWTPKQFIDAMRNKWYPGR